jgi:hypothetical protein
MFILFVPQPKASTNAMYGIDKEFLFPTTIDTKEGYKMQLLQRLNFLKIFVMLFDFFIFYNVHFLF